MKRQRRKKVFSASRYPIGPPRVPNVSGNRRSAGSATARNGEPEAKAASAYSSGVTDSTAVATKGRFWLFSGIRGKIQAAAMEVDRVDEVLFVAEAAGRVLHPLDLGVDGFASGVGDAVLEVGDNVGESAFEHAGHFLHRTEAAAHRPTVPPLEVLPRRTFI